jgi:DNA-binding transcriptional MocR family regulator
MLLSWLNGFETATGPAYLRIARALEAAVTGGELQPGDRLPPQRLVAEHLGVDLTTVTRAYSEARQQGLLEGAVGRGSFVRQPPADEAGRVDLTMNLPPIPEGFDLGRLLAETTAAVLGRTEAAQLMAYHPEGGSTGQRLAGRRWLEPVLGPRAPQEILVAPGAQAALTAIFSTLCRPGDVVLAEPLTYPGLISLCRQLGVRLISCAADGQGLVPEAVIEVGRRERPRALYLVPTLQNPTALTLSERRRQALASAAAEAGAWIVEDDPYSRLLDAPPPALAALAPERVIYVATLAKALTPGLRLAYVASPPGEMAERLAAALRNIAQMPAPLMAAVATTWIREGQAQDLLKAVIAETRHRRRLAARLLPQAKGEAESLHLWLALPPGASAAGLKAAAHGRGIALASQEAFAVTSSAAPGARLSLGGPVRRSALERALQELNDLVAAEPPE